MILLGSRHLTIALFGNSSSGLTKDYLLGLRIFPSTWEKDKKRKTIVFGFLLFKLVVVINYFYLNNEARLLVYESYNKGLETAKSVVKECFASEVQDKEVMLAAIEKFKKS